MTEFAKLSAKQKNCSTVEKKLLQDVRFACPNVKFEFPIIFSKHVIQHRFAVIRSTTICSIPLIDLCTEGDV